VRRGSTTTMRRRALASLRLPRSRHRPQAAVRHHRFAPRISRKSLRSMSEHRMVSSREHEPRRELLRHLVERRRRKEVARAEALSQTRAVEQQADLVRGPGCRRPSRPRRVRARRGSAAGASRFRRTLRPTSLDEAAIAASRAACAAGQVLVKILERKHLRHT